MREEIADLVYPVLTYGIWLRKRLADNDEVPDFTTAQTKLKGLLQSTSQAQRLADFGGDRPIGESMRTRGDQFEGIRYALACWLDEIFIFDSPWQEQWNENSLEWDLYKIHDRAWKFWEQARLASARPSTDALEVFFLCAMLGFRGDKSPEELKDWCEATKGQLETSQGNEWTPPVEGQPRTYVPLLTGAERLQNMLNVAGIAVLVLFTALAFLLFGLGHRP
jgi:type VI secretion system protein ImpK